jgi:hypothetical protein
VKLKAFKKFEDTAEAVQSATALVEGKLSATMKKFLKKNVVGDSLKVCERCFLGCGGRWSALPAPACLPACV